MIRGIKADKSKTADERIVLILISSVLARDVLLVIGSDVLVIFVEAVGAGEVLVSFDGVALGAEGDGETILCEGEVRLEGE